MVLSTLLRVLKYAVRKHYGEMVINVSLLLVRHVMDENSSK